MLAETLRVQHSVSVLAFSSVFLSSVLMVAVFAHSISIISLFGVWAFVNDFSMLGQNCLFQRLSVHSCHFEDNSLIVPLLGRTCAT